MLHFQSQDDDKRSHDLMSKLSFKAVVEPPSPPRAGVSSPCYSQIRFPTLQNLASNLTSSGLDLCFIQWKTSRFARSIDVAVSSLRRVLTKWWGTCAFSAELHPADQPGIWLRVWNHLMPETLFHDGAFLATVDSSYKHYEKILTKSMIQHTSRVYRRMGNISASQKLKKKN